MADYYGEATVRRGSSTGSPQPNELHEVLNHGLDCADGLRLLKPTSDKSAAFFRYFQDDTTPAAALAPHKTKLARQEDGEGLLASSAVNPPVSTVYHWFCGWRRGQYGDEGGKANRWQQSLNSSSCLWIPSHSWRPRAQLEAVTNDTAELQKIYEEWWRQPSLAAGNPCYATALQQLLRQMHKIRKESPGRSLPMKAGFTSARRCGSLPGVALGSTGDQVECLLAKSSASKKVKRSSRPEPQRQRWGPRAQGVCTTAEKPSALRLSHSHSSFSLFRV
ncbi:hypothetical protein HPB48_018047 [Haemaphysalis longicornis]|uniref:Uncharacterized protein n=1 Tax=Haemaphysalis longicornis TaxID=44386 RepID=A0A9J6FUY1_HAELO|nr:hypothetical protein HPB48_018047 [Haemaphysalis longicornis]